MRKLVTVKQITDIKTIPNADNIDVATINHGWKVVVKKNEFQIGDDCVYFEIDSILPDDDERFRFLMHDVTTLPTDMGTMVRGVKLRTMRLRGQLSQGLALPTRLFKDSDLMAEDIASVLGIYKYEKFIVSNEAKGNYPSFVRKTDQERIQNIISEIDFNSDEKWEVTAKLDGCSGTYYYNKGDTGLCSRNLELKPDISNVYTFVNNRYKILDKLSEYCTRISKNMAIQGEVYGLKCNGNPMHLNEIAFAVFNVWDIDSHAYVKPDVAKSMCDMLGIPYIMQLSPLTRHYCTFRELNCFTLDDLLEIAECNKGEGIVFKSMDREYSFKVINNQYLLKVK